MDLFQQVTELFDRQIKFKPNLKTGSKELDDFLKSQFQLSFLDKIDIDRLDAEFKDEVRQALTSNKVSNDIKSIYFGLVTFAGDIKGSSLTTIHVGGSRSTPKEDDEWACDIHYKNRNYINLVDFELLDSSLTSVSDNKGMIEVVIFNGLLNLLLINSVDVIKTLTFNGSNRKSLWLGAGFDSGDCCLLGELSA